MSVLIKWKFKDNYFQGITIGLKVNYFACIDISAIVRYEVSVSPSIRVTAKNRGYRLADIRDISVFKEEMVYQPYRRQLAAEVQELINHYVEISLHTSQDLWCNHSLSRSL